MSLGTVSACRDQSGCANRSSGNKWLIRLAPNSTKRLEVAVPDMPCGEGFQHRCKSIHGRCDGDVLSPTLLEALPARHASSPLPHQPCSSSRSVWEPGRFGDKIILKER